MVLSTVVLWPRSISNSQPNWHAKSSLVNPVAALLRNVRALLESSLTWCYLHSYFGDSEHFTTGNSFCSVASIAVIRFAQLSGSSLVWPLTNLHSF